MDDNCLNHQNGMNLSGGVSTTGSMGSTSNTNSGNSNAKQNEPEANHVKPQYSIPGIIHFIQHEWARFELERSQWEVDRAELQARIAFLQGERRGQENLKCDLVRRIKMLEYALQQERAKCHKLKFGTDLPNADVKPATITSSIESNSMDDESHQMILDSSYFPVTNSTWKQGRQLLRQYLQEIGYTDKLIDIRSSRVRTMLGLNHSNAAGEETYATAPIEAESGTNKRAVNSQVRTTPAKRTQTNSFTDTMLLDTEVAVMANLDFLSNTDVDMDDDDDLSDEADMDSNDDVDDEVKQKDHFTKTSPAPKIEDDVDKEAMAVVDDLRFISESQKQFWYSDGSSKQPIIISDEDHIDSTLGLGELAQLTVNNEVEGSYDSAGLNDDYRKTWNAKYTLRSHFDSVQALAFHPTESVLITASEDHTMKLWNLQKTVASKRSPSLDVEPLYTFRNHAAPILSLTVSNSGDYCYSGDLNGIINCWKVPNANVDPYDEFEPQVLNTSLSGHSDAVWCLSLLHSSQYLASCSADSSVKLWAPHTQTQWLNTFTSEDVRIPSSVDFIQSEPHYIVAAYGSFGCIVFDTETSQPIVRFECPTDVTNLNSKQINKVVCHPTLPIIITAHEDHHIRFWDVHTGTMVHSMVAHLDAVTSLAVDPNGLYLLSGSHDCSIRLWHLDNKTCVQEITAHRKKFDESILDVAFHPTRPYIASAGADGLAKVFV